MSIRSKALLTLCACTVVLGVVAGSAAASVEKLLFLTESGSSEVTASSREPVTFTMGETTVRCNVTLAGRLQEEVAPRSGEPAGSIERITTSRCEGGERPFIVALSLPWSMTYSSFSGSQPEAMTAVLTPINGVSINIASGRLSCLYRGEVGLSFALTGTNPYTIGALTTLTNSLSLVSGAGCARTASMRGSFTLSQEAWLAELQPLPMQASPYGLRRSQALTATNITFRNIETGNITATGVTWEGSNGWAAEIGSCTFALWIAPNNTCTVRMLATPTADIGRLMLRNGSTLIGALFLTRG